MRAMIALVVVLMCAPEAAAQFPAPVGEVVVLLPDSVAERATATITPMYPAIANSAQVRAVVRLAMQITEAGIVDRVRVEFGNPMLDGAAINGMRQWRFRPFLSPTGQPAAVEVMVDVAFVDPGQGAVIKRELQGYYRAAQECSGAMAAAPAAAETILTCEAVLAAVQRLQISLSARADAEFAVGQAKRKAGRYDAALPHYEWLLSDAKRSGSSWRAGGAYLDVAQVYRLLNNLPAAAKHFAEAVDRLEDAAKEQSDFIKELTRTGRSADVAIAARGVLLGRLRQALEEQIVVLTQLNKTKDAARAEKRLAALPAP